MKTFSFLNQTKARPHFILTAKNLKIPLGEQTKIMGIVNITPDSFSHDGLIKNRKTDYHDAAFRYAQKLIREGADIIDLGGESSRPGSNPVNAPEELKRIIPTLKRLTKTNRVPISVDTYKPLVAKNALEAGASIINNIRGTQIDKSLLKMICDYKAAIVLMHMRGTPQTMQKNITYKNLVREITKELKKSIEICLEIGIKSDRIIIDPGIGFGKTAEQNLEIINCLDVFQTLNQPILIGTSRKSFIGKILKQEVHERLMGTAATVCNSILHGAHIVRIHDVGKLKNLIRMSDAIRNMKVE